MMVEEAEQEVTDILRQHVRRAREIAERDQQVTMKLAVLQERLIYETAVSDPKRKGRMNEVVDELMQEALDELNP